MIRPSGWPTAVRSTPSSGPSARLRSNCVGRPARSSAGAPSSRRSPRSCKEASTRLAAVTLEGEPGIGKTRLLLAAAELASASGFTCVAITADEEIRGPFLVARSLFASSADPRHGRRDAGGGRGQARGRGYLRARRARLRDPVAGRQAPPGLRSRGRRDLDARGDAPACAAHRRRPVGRRRHPPAAPLCRPERRRSADLPVPDDSAGRVRDGHRGGELRRRHGADGARPAASAGTVRLRRNGRAPEARPWRARSRPSPRPRCTSSPRACRSSSRSWPGRTARPARSSSSTASGGSAATRPGSCRRRSGRSSIAAPRDCLPGPGPRSAMPRSWAAASACATSGRSGPGSARARSRPPRTGRRRPGM